MKIRILAAFIVASAIAAPAFAGTDAPALTRAQVRAELFSYKRPATTSLAAKTRATRSNFRRPKRASQRKTAAQALMAVWRPTGRRQPASARTVIIGTMAACSRFISLNDRKARFCMDGGTVPGVSIACEF